MFKISDMIRNFAPQAVLEVENETLVSYLGLVGYGPKTTYGTFLESEKYFEGIDNNVTTVIATEKLKSLLIQNGYGVVIVENPRITFFKLHNYLCGENEYIGTKTTTTIKKNVQVDCSARIAQDNVEIGNNVVIEENVIIRENTKIGDNVIIRAGSIIGGQQFEYKKEEDAIFHVTHVGMTEIKDNVEIGYNSVIGAAIYPWDSTVIEEYTKIGDGSTIGHGAKIGKRCMLSTRNIVCGRAICGDDVWLGPNAIISNDIKIGERAHVGIGSVVISDVLADKSVYGNPARNMIVRS